MPIVPKFITTAKSCVFPVEEPKRDQKILKPGKYGQLTNRRYDRAYTSDSVQD
jgi:hypothetical protein